jgi:hypothetical protein
MISVIMLSVIMLSVIMLSVIMLSVIMLNVLMLSGMSCPKIQHSILIFFVIDFLKILFVIKIERKVIVRNFANTAPRLVFVKLLVNL